MTLSHKVGFAIFALAMLAYSIYMETGCGSHAEGIMTWHGKVCLAIQQ